jgi:hypothetical protein
MHTPRLYLHIGEPKTGTTFVQETLWENRAKLAARGVLLPGYSDRDHSRASRDLRSTRRPESDPAERWQGEWDVLTAQALQAPQSAVISNELLAACQPDTADQAVRKLLAAEVHIVLTMRDIGSLLPAEWQETVKCRGTASWEEWLSDVVAIAPAADRRRHSWFWRLHDTMAILDMWSRHIPPEHVHAITLPRHGPPEALWARFASVLGIDSIGFNVRQRNANTSLGLVEAEFLRRMNGALSGEMPYWFYTRNIKRILGHDVLTTRPGKERLGLPPAHEPWAREQAENLIARLRDSKYDLVGDLDDLLPQPATGRSFTTTGLPADQLLEAAVCAAAALADHQYLDSRPAGPQQPRPQGLRQMVSRLEWIILNGRFAKRVLRNASHLAAVRWLRVWIWRVLMHPARHRANPVPGGNPDDTRSVPAEG